MNEFSISMVTFSVMAMMLSASTAKATNIPVAKSLIFPIKGYTVNDSYFLHEDIYDGKDWGLHLGEDMRTEPATHVMAVGDGLVVYSGNHPGVWKILPDKSRQPIRNWGNLIIIAHQNPKDGKIFLSVYGHLGERYVKKGQIVSKGEVIGDVGAADTPENGLWYAHLHFAIYVGPFPWHKSDGSELKILPGYYKPEEGLTKLKWWKEPSKFIRDYPNG